MNDKDKEAFEKWYKINFSELVKETGLAKMQNDFIKAWQAACEYKQKEIDELKNVIHWTVEQNGKVTRHISIAEIEKLQAENAKLRKCVEFYASTGALNDEHDFFILKDYKFSIPTTRRARQVLKELEEK